VKCPVCGEALNFNFRITYNDIQMCIRCAYLQAPPDSPARKSLERNYPEVIDHDTTT
jgi:hypothetical protein